MCIRDSCYTHFALLTCSSVLASYTTAVSLCHSVCAYVVDTLSAINVALCIQSCVQCDCIGWEKTRIQIYAHIIYYRSIKAGHSSPRVRRWIPHRKWLPSSNAVREIQSSRNPLLPEVSKHATLVPIRCLSRAAKWPFQVKTFQATLLNHSCNHSNLCNHLLNHPLSFPPPLPTPLSLFTLLSI